MPKPTLSADDSLHVVTAITCLPSSRIGPPELPGLIAASVCTKRCSSRSWLAWEMTPSVSDSGRPTGKPMMLTFCLGRRPSLVATWRTSSGSAVASSTIARSRRGWMRRTVPRTRRRSRSSTATLRYGATTWQLVTRRFGAIRKPVPVPPPVKT